MQDDDRVLMGLNAHSDGRIDAKVFHINVIYDRILRHIRDQERDTHQIGKTPTMRIQALCKHKRTHFKTFNA